MQRRGAVDDGHAGANRRHAFFAGDHRDAGHRLADRVVADLLAVGTELPVRGDVDHDDARVQRLERVIPEAHLLDCPGAEVLHEHVGDLDELAQGGLRFLLAHVHADAFLAGVVLNPVRALFADPRSVVTGLLPTQALYLNDFCTQAGKHLGTPGSRLMAAQVDNADAIQRPFESCHIRHSLLSAVHRNDPARWAERVAVSCRLIWYTKGKARAISREGCISLDQRRRGAVGWMGSMWSSLACCAPA